MQHGFRKDPLKYAHNELAIVILKPDYTKAHKQEVKKFINEHKLTIESEGTIILDTFRTLALYNDIFKFNSQDILFGYTWKDQKLAYMTSGNSYYYILRGKNAQSYCETFKYAMREKHSKLSIPEKKLNTQEFEDLAIKNLIHVVNTHETEIAIRLLSTELSE